MDVENWKFLPSLEDECQLKETFSFHIMEVIVKYFRFLQGFHMPKYIPHPYVKEMSEKSVFEVLDLPDKRENRGDDMIDILQFVHTFLPTCLGETVDRTVFGGDVLTNERAYQAQLDMANASTQSSKLHGLLHKPEGLHLCMNFAKYILEIFFSRSSVLDPGTLYSLAVNEDRRNSTLDMTKG